jgi:hypothetical protein
MADLKLDHVVLGVADLDEAADRLARDHGLTALPGGRHPGWGTANRIVPLGACYLELVTVVDAGAAASSDFGRWVLSMLAGGPAVGWAVRTSDLASVAARLGLDVVDGTRTTADGTVLRWRLAGVAAAAGDPSLPFFIEWGPGTPLPGRTSVVHAVGPTSLAELVVGGGSEPLAAWLGTEVEDLEGVKSVEGPPGVRTVTLSPALTLVDHGVVAVFDQGNPATTP